MVFLSESFCRALDNGVRVCCLHRNSASVELQFHIATGSIHEGRFLGHGLSHFLEHMLFQGCKGYPRQAIADTVNLLGGDVNAYTTFDRTCFRMQLPAAHWRRGMEMLSAMVRFPTLPAARFKAEREVILRECERSADNPDSRLFDEFMRNMFLTHPFRHPVIGYRELIAAVDRDMAAEYHHLRYTPGRCVVAAVGPVDPDALCALAGELLDDWPRGELAEVPLPVELPLTTARAERIAFPDPSSRVMCGVRGPGFGSPELPGLDLLFGILGAGEGALLNRKLVLESGLGLGVRSSCMAWGGDAVAVVSGRCEPGKLDDFDSALHAELDAVAAGKIDPAAVEREKEQQYADRLREFRDNGAAAGELAAGILSAGNPAAGDAYLEHLLRADLPGLQRIAAEYLDSEHRVSVIQEPETSHSFGTAKPEKRVLTANTLDDGGTLIWSPERTLPLVNFIAVLPGGAICEPPELRGVGKLTAAALLTGSAGLPEASILDRLDEAGVEIEPTSGLNSFLLEFSVPRRNVDRAVALIAEILHSPQFGADAWEREKARQLSLLRERESTPLKRALDAASRMMYGAHPYADGGFGTIDGVAALSPEDGREWFRRCAYAAGTVWGVGGDCSEAEADKWCRILREAIPCASVAPQMPAEPVFSQEKKFVEVTLPREQTVAIRLLPGVVCRPGSDEMDVTDLLLQMENGLGSRLFKTVREQHALSYAVGMTYAAGFHPGYFGFYALTAPQAGKKTLALIDEEISRLRDERPETAEFNAARNSAAFEAERAVDTVESRLRTAAMEAFYGGNAAEVLDRPQKLQSMTAERFHDALRRLFSRSPGVEALAIGRPETRH